MHEIENHEPTTLELKLTDRQSLHQKIGWKRPCQEFEIENTTDPAVACTVEVEIFADIEDGGVT